MSIQPDLVGTITLTSGSTAFTWAGTSLVSANIQPGDQILLPAKAMVLTIGGSESDITATGGILTNNCPAGAAGSSQAARIRYQSDLSRVAAQTRQLIGLLGGGNISSLAALVGAADRGVHFTGAGTMALHTLTAFARSLLDDANEANARTTLGITGDLVSSLALSSFGNYVPSEGNLNTVPAGDSGLYGSGNTGAPVHPGVSFWWIETQRMYSGDARRQIATNYSSSGAVGSVMMVRICSNSGAWGEWRGLTIERGSNANGEYVRFPDGTQICLHREAINLAVTSAVGSSYRDGAIPNWTFPSSFLTANGLVGGFHVGSSFIWGTGVPANGTFMARTAISAVTFTGAATCASWAIGRWF